jgi:hypothetical protein
VKTATAPGGGVGAGIGASGAVIAGGNGDPEAVGSGDPPGLVDGEGLALGTGDALGLGDGEAGAAPLDTGAPLGAGDALGSAAATAAIDGMPAPASTVTARIEAASDSMRPRRLGWGRWKRTSNG